MAILSKIKSTVKKITEKVKSGLKSLTSFTPASTVANVYKGLDYNSPANKKLQEERKNQPAYGTEAYYKTKPDYASTVGANLPGSIETGGYLDYSKISYPKGKSSGPSLPATVSADPRTISRSNTSTSNKVTSSAAFSSVANQLNSPLRTSSLSSSPSSSGTISGGSYGLPSSGSSNATAPKIDTTRLAGGMSGLYKYNDQTGQFEVAEDTSVPDNSLETKAQDRADLLKQYLGVEPSVYDDKEVRRAMKERNALRESLQAPTAELNAVLAKQQQDLLQLRATGAQEGVTEAVYGQQQNAVNYAAAVRALPLQASIANIQGQIELAQDYLSELVTVKTEQIKRKYEYNKQLFNSISGLIDKEDERSYQELKTKNDREYKTQTELEAFKGDLMMESMKNGAPASVINRINNSSDRNSAIQAAGRFIASPDTQLTRLDNGDTVLVNTRNGQIISNIGGKREAEVQPGENPQLYSGLSTGTATAVRSLVSKYGSEPTIQNFATIQDGYNFAKSIENKTTNPADDQALIYSLAKTLDPGSVVREGEYATAQKYAQSWVKSYGKGVTQAIAGTGFLSEEARTNIKKTIEQKYNSSKVSYEKQYKEYIGQINNLTGRKDGEKFIRSYVTDGGQGTGQSNQSGVDYTATLDSLFQ